MMKLEKIEIICKKDGFYEKRIYSKTKKMKKSPGTVFRERLIEAGFTAEDFK